MNPKNEQIKRKFQKYCKHSMGYSEKTITSIMKAVCDYQEFSNLEDFKNLMLIKQSGIKIMQSTKLVPEQMKKLN